jgi:hypothetical protein
MGYGHSHRQNGSSEINDLLGECGLTRRTGPLELDEGTKRELCSLYVPQMVKSLEQVMVRSVFEEAIALASLSLFLATIAVWAQVWSQVLGVL